MSQMPRFYRLRRVSRALLWIAPFLVFTLITFGKPVSWAAPVPHKQLTLLPMITSPLINNCDFYLYACNLTAGYAGVTPTYDWSPDGHTIAFYRAEAEDGARGIYTMNEQGQNRCFLLKLSNIDFIRYSPDGTMIVLNAARYINGQSINGLYVYTFATGQVRLLSDPASVDYFDLSPDWSPDSSKLAFIRYQQSRTTADIYTIRPNGSELKQLTDTPLNEQMPTYSPDGTRIAYAVSDDTNPSIEVSVAVMDANGSEPKNLTSAVAPFTNNPFWAADSNSIFFFAATENHDWDIYNIHVDGSDPINLTHDALQQSDPVLSPDGSQILFVGKTNTEPFGIDLYTIRIDGSNMTKYPNPHGKDRYPDRVKWHPDGQRISYLAFTNEEDIYLLRLRVP